MSNQKLISQAVEALKVALDGWKTACIDATGNPNIEFLAQFEINLASILEKDPPVEVCPCTLADEPCHPHCSCVKPHMSRGCVCCARYGSPEQRQARAQWIVDTLREAAYCRSADPEA